MTNRSDGRTANQIRDIKIIKDFQKNPLASVLIECGNTRVMCSVSLENKVPGWMKAQDVPGGWVTAEYSMLPSSTHTRTRREVKRGKESGRTMEIQRLIGRSLRAAIDLEKLGPITLNIDCDVIDADGGTRCASITGASVALELAVHRLLENGTLTVNPLKEKIAAISVGIVEGEPLLDLCYVEDSAAQVDMNVIMTESGKFVEIQGTAEEQTFSFDELNAMTKLAKEGIDEIFKLQNEL